MGMQVFSKLIETMLEAIDKIAHKVDEFSNWLFRMIDGDEK